MKMNVLFVHQAAELYGSDRVLLALVDCLKRGGLVHPIVVIPESGPLLAELQKVGVEVHVESLAKIQRSAFTPFGIVRLIFQLVRSLRGLNAVVAGRSIAAVHSNTVAVLSGAVWSRMRRVRHIWHIHEVIRSPAVVARGLAWLVCILSDRVACISQAVRDNLVKQCSRIDRLCDVVPNGIAIPARDIESSRQTCRAARGWSEEVVVGLVGRINAWKGQDVLVRAAKTILHSNPPTPIRFVILGGPPPGQGEFLTQLRRQIEGAGLTDHVEIIDFMPDVWPIWCAMDIAVVPSTEPEPFGMVALEAMCAARPVLASGHGGLVDIVVDGQTGRLFPPGDSDALAAQVLLLTLNEELRGRMGRSGRDRAVSQFGLEDQAKAFLALYENSQTRN